MKLEALHLKAFGAFTDRRLDFSGGRAGLHLIHGPNEAGKSTALRAITQLLYGIAPRTADDFLHPMQHLRIGATLSNGEDTLTFYRRKGNKNTLLGPDEKKKLADDALAPFLGGVDEAAFTNFFGLSHEQLVRGGEGLIQGEGDVGQALFSAAAGMGNLRALLSRLEADAGELFKPSASKPSINHALSQLKELRKETRAKQLSSSEWESLDRERAEALARRAAVDSELQSARAEEKGLRRVLDALPLVSQRASLQEKLAPFREAALLKEDFAERRHQCRTDALAAESRRETAAKALAAYEKELDGLRVNDAVLANEDLIEELNETRAQNQKALEDCERELVPLLRRLEEEAERALHHIRPHWTIDQVEDLRLGPGQERRIHELSREGEALKVRHANAEAALKKAQREHARIQDELEGLGQATDPAGVERAIKHVNQAGVADDAIESNRRELATRKKAISAGIKRLGLWSGTAEALESLPVPPSSTIEHFRIELEDGVRKVEASRAAVAASEEELRGLEAQLLAYQKAHDAPSLESLAETRRRRQEGWRHARSAWEARTAPAAVSDPDALTWLERLRAAYPDAENLADAYAAVVEEADTTADRLRNEADRVAGRAQLESSVANLRSRLDEQRQQVGEHEAELADRETEWRAAWEASGIAPRTPREMAEWKQSHGALLDGLATLRELEALVEAQTEKAAQLQSQLATAMENAGADGETTGMRLADLIPQAEAWIASQREVMQERKQLESAGAQLEREGLPDAEVVLTQATEALERWSGDWSGLAEDLGAPGDASSGEVLALVEAINDLLAKAMEAKELRGRIARIRRDDEQFRTEVHTLLEAVGVAVEAGEEMGQVRALYAELKRSRVAAQDRERLKTLRDGEAETLRDAEAVLARVAVEQQLLCDEAEVPDPDALADAEKASNERRRLEEAIRSIDVQLTGLSAGAGLEAFLAMVDAEEGDSLEPRTEAIAAKIQELDDERLALQERLGRLDQQLRQMDGSDGAAAKEADAQTLLAAISDDSERYARLRIAAHVLRTAIERFRAANQEPLLARAGEIFEALTLGSLAGLRADVNEKDEHVLCGVRAETGALVPVDGMSEGTADQLYLALRIASLERHLEAHAPVPFILDDILVNFDDARSVAALEVLAAVSERTQVIYFTHHAHLVELAKGCVDGGRLFVQDLAG